MDRQTVQASAAEASLTFHICFLIKIAINSFQSCLGMAPTDLLAHVKGITSSFGDGKAVSLMSAAQSTVATTSELTSTTYQGGPM